MGVIVRVLFWSFLFLRLSSNSRFAALCKTTAAAAWSYDSSDWMRLLDVWCRTLFPFVGCTDQRGPISCIARRLENVVPACRRLVARLESTLYATRYTTCRSSLYQRVVLSKCSSSPIFMLYYAHLPAICHLHIDDGSPIIFLAIHSSTANNDNYSINGHWIEFPLPVHNCNCILPNVFHFIMLLHRLERQWFSHLEVIVENVS